jgi:DNA-binding transcriptional MerR regulator
MPARTSPTSANCKATRPQTADEVVADHRSDDAGELFGIAELCKQFSISPRAIRFYEDKGLLAPRRINGTRVYTRRDRARLQLILRAKTIGSSLAEIKHYLDLYGAHGEGRTVQMRYVLDRTSKAIAELEQKRAHIEASLAELRIINATVKRGLGK